MTKGVRVDPATRTARTGGGRLTGDVGHASRASGLGTPDADGRRGYPSREYGLAADSLPGPGDPAIAIHLGPHMTRSTRPSCRGEQPRESSGPRGDSQRRRLRKTTVAERVHAHRKCLLDCGLHTADQPHNNDIPPIAGPVPAHCLGHRARGGSGRSLFRDARRRNGGRWFAVYGLARGALTGAVIAAF